MPSHNLKSVCGVQKKENVINKFLWLRGETKVCSASTQKLSNRMKQNLAGESYKH